MQEKWLCFCKAEVYYNRLSNHVISHGRRLDNLQKCSDCQTVLLEGCTLADHWATEEHSIRSLALRTKRKFAFFFSFVFCSHSFAAGRRGNERPPVALPNAPVTVPLVQGGSEMMDQAHAVGGVFEAPSVPPAQSPVNSNSDVADLLDDFGQSPSADLEGDANPSTAFEQNVEEVFMSSSAPSDSGGYHVASILEIENYLRDNPDTGHDMSSVTLDSFDEMVEKAGVSHPEILENWLNATGKGTDIPPLPESASFVREVPICWTKDDPTAISAYAVLVPLVRIYEGWMSNTRICDSLLPVGSRKKGFTDGAYWAAVEQLVPGNSVPLCVALNCDKTQVVNMGQRSLHPVYISILNSTLPTIETGRICMFIPILDAHELGLRPVPMGLLRKLVFHASMGVLVRTGALTLNDTSLQVVARDAKTVYSVYPWCGLFVADSKDQDQAAARRGGGRSAVLCGRCGATIDSPEIGAKCLITSEQEAKIRKALCVIARREEGQVARAKEMLKALAVHEVEPFTWSLRHFEASVNIGTDILHTGWLVWTKETIQHVGLVLLHHPEAENQQGRGRRKDDLPPEKAYVERLNRRIADFTGIEDCFDRKTGALDLPRKTGIDCRRLCEMLPFAMYGVVPEDTAWLVDHVVLWNSLCNLWATAGPPEAPHLHEMVHRFDQGIQRVAQVLGLDMRAVRQKPTLHFLQHIATDIQLFGSSKPLSTVPYEQLHAFLTKGPFREHSNKTTDERSIARQILMWNSRFGMGAAITIKDEVVGHGPGIVGLHQARMTSLREWMITSQKRPALVRVAWGAVLELVARTVFRHPGFSDAGLHLGPTGFDIGLAADLDIFPGTGVRASSDFSVVHIGDNSVGRVQSCVLELSFDHGNQFGALIAAFQLASNRHVPRLNFVIVKLFAVALAECPRYKMPLVSDARDYSSVDSYAVIQLSQIVQVFDAVVACSDPYQLIYPYRRDRR